MTKERANLDQAYMDFIEGFRLPAKTLLNIYSSSIFKYFYNTNETEQLIARYTRPPQLRVIGC